MKPTRLQFLPIVTLLLVSSVISASVAQGQTSASIVFVPLAPLSAYDSPTSSGWGTGSQAVTAVGMDLSWVSISETLGTPASDPDQYTYQITNLTDLTNLDLTRYLSFTFDPRSALGTSEFVLSALNTRKTFNLLAPGENFQIRTSYDNFASPLITFDGVDGSATGVVSPDTIPTASNIAVNRHAPTMADTLSEPLELRFYYYGTDLDGSPAIDSYGAGVGGGPYTVSVLAVPETSSVLLLGAAGILGALRRRRA